MGYTAIVTDSTAGIKPEYAARHQVTVIPLYVKMGERVLREGIELDADTFYRELPHMSSLPTTSQPSIGDFTRVYDSVIRDGATSIISIHLSAGISGTINSATQAAQQFHIPIEIVDSRCATAAHYFMTQACVDALEHGASFSDAVERAKQVRDSQRTMFIPETLEYLYKGGRIGGAAALMGSLLQMKPLLVFRDGKIDAFERVRGLNHAYTRMVEVMAEWMGTTEPLRLMVMHSQCEENAAQLMSMVRAKLNIALGEVLIISPVIGVHTGPGTVGLCCCPASLCGETVD